MTKKQYEAKRNELLTEAQNLINQGKTEEAQAKMEEVEQLDDKWTEIAKAQANFNALNREPVPMNPFGVAGESVNIRTGKDVEAQNDVEKAWASEIYQNAWAKHIRNEKMTAEEETSFRMVNEAYTHTTGNTSIVVPKTVSTKIWEEAGEMYPYFGDCAKTYVNGVLAMIKEDSSSEAAWYEEDAETEDGKETFKEFTLNGCELSRSITVSWKLREMAIEDFIPYITRKMAKKIGAALGYGATHGAGNANKEKPEPTGVVTALKNEEGTPQVVEYTGETPTLKEILKTRGLIKGGYAAGLKVYANSSTIWNKIANILDTNKRPIFIPDATSGGVYRVLGMVVKEDDSMKDGEILFSNAEDGYSMNINKEMTVLPEEHVKARKTDYCGYAIADGNAVTNKAHALLAQAEQSV